MASQPTEDRPRRGRPRNTMGPIRITLTSDPGDRVRVDPAELARWRAAAAAVGLPLQTWVTSTLAERCNVILGVQR